MQPQFVYHASLEVWEECGAYTKAELYRQKDCASVIVIHFCDSGDFEGLDGKYSMGEDNKIYDSDGEEILYRNLSTLDPVDPSQAISTSDVIAANAKFGGKKLSSAFFRRHAIVRLLRLHDFLRPCALL